MRNWERNQNPVPLFITAISIDIIEVILPYLPGQSTLRMNQERWDGGGVHVNT